MEFIKNQEWRYATKYFDTDKKVSDDDLEMLKEAVRLAPSSYGLQSYKVMIIKDQTLKEKLKEAAYGQNQLKDSSHVFVFCHHTQISDDLVEDFIKRKAKAEDVSVEKVEGYGSFIKKTVAEMEDQNRIHWSRRQTYLAAGNLLNACAELKIDACPMEGFENEKFDEILSLSIQGLASSIVVPIGYRSSADKTQFIPKVRKPANELFEVI